MTGKGIPRQVWILSMVSLFTDIASEMLYPVTPIFLASAIGSSMAAIGIIEGIAEVTAGVLKGYFGVLSDKLERRSIFVKIGYGISAIVKPLPGILPGFAAVLFSRVADRIGKGIRTAPRDALLAGYAGINTGRVFGFHRSMDTLGAALGPVAALLLLKFFPGNYPLIYIVAFIPSILALSLTLAVKDRPVVHMEFKRKDYRLFWKQAPVQYKRLLFLFTIFSLVNSSDVFLILKSREIARSDSQAIAGYIFYNIIYAFASYPAGILSDRWGKRRMYITGLLIFSLVYMGFALSDSRNLMWLLFILYGLYAAATEGISKAWVADLTGDELRGTAIGLITMSGSLAVMAGSVITGLMWDFYGSQVPFALSSIISLITAAALYIFTVKNQ